jgi:hypothetical protein
MATQSNSGLDLIKSIPEALEMYYKAINGVERYKLIFGELPESYGKVDVALAYKTYQENEDFHQNFGRYVEALRAKLEVTDLKLKDPDTKTKGNSKSPVTAPKEANNNE